MDIYKSSLPGVLILAPAASRDDRGFFLELYRESMLGDVRFVQDNFSFSKAGVLRGLHFQEPNAQGKLVQVLRGAIFDVAVDVRRGSPTFGKWYGVNLTDVNHQQMYVPPGFAHGFFARQDSDVMYKCTAYYDADSERTIAWDDPSIGIKWSLHVRPAVSERDARAPRLKDAAVLPEYIHHQHQDP